MLLEDGEQRSTDAQETSHTAGKLLLVRSCCWCGWRCCTKLRLRVVARLAPPAPVTRARKGAHGNGGRRALRKRAQPTMAVGSTVKTEGARSTARATAATAADKRCTATAAAAANCEHCA